MKIGVIFSCLLLVGGWAVAADDIADIGSIKTLSGKAYIIRDGKALMPEVGQKFYAKDVLKTGKDGTMGIILNDNTVMSLGPGSQFEISKFKFAPKEKSFSLFSKMTKGSLSYLSGTIGKLAPKSVKFETPDASIGIRGTKFFVKVE